MSTFDEDMQQYNLTGDELVHELKLHRELIDKISDENRNRYNQGKKIADFGMHATVAGVFLVFFILEFWLLIVTGVAIFIIGITRMLVDIDFPSFEQFLDLRYPDKGRRKNENQP